jgi:alpha-beta hydrolase superfamily lysophospholipase
MGKGVRKIVTRLNKQNFSRIDIQLYPNMRHEPLHEKDNQIVYQDVLAWLESHASDS